MVKWSGTRRQCQVRTRRVDASLDRALEEADTFDMLSDASNPDDPTPES